MRQGVVLFGLVLAAACGGDADVPGRVTYHEHVAPIVYANCSGCHRPGQVAPFSLLSYADVKAYAAEIARETAERRMPPWLPAPGEFRFQGSRRLSDAHLETIQRWIKQGMAEGDPARGPAPPAFPDGWESGTPDLIVSMAAPYVLTSQAADVYRNFVMRVPLTRERFVRAVEFRANGAPIHHAVIRVDGTAQSRRRDGRDGAPGFDGMSWSASDPDGQFVGWAPGRGPIASPAGMAWRLPPDTDLVVEMHMIPGEAPVTVAPQVGLFFTDETPTLRPVTLKLGSKVIDIPPGEANYRITDSVVLPHAVRLLSVYPHAHYLGRDMEVTVTWPDGAARTLLHIPQWNFHWQQDYRLETPLDLPAGTRVTMRYVYDNSDGNPFNPSQPPVRVQAGPKSTDEMAELGLQVLAATPEQAAELDRMFVEREQRANIALGEQRVGQAPDNAEYRAFLGGSLAEAGRYVEAIPHLEAAIRLGDRTAATEGDLGAAKMASGRAADALGHFQRAVALAPDDEVMWFNLGTTLSALARSAEAEAAFRKALSLNPDYVDAHVNLGVVLIGRRRMDEAVTHFARAAALRPDSAVMHSNLAGALMAAGRRDEALAAARRALAIDPQHPAARATVRRLEGREP